MKPTGTSWLTEVVIEVERRAKAQAEAEVKGMLLVLTGLVSRGLLTADVALAELDRLVGSGELAKKLVEEGRQRLLGDL